MESTAKQTASRIIINNKNWHWDKLEHIRRHFPPKIPNVSEFKWQWRAWADIGENNRDMWQTILKANFLSYPKICGKFPQIPTDLEKIGRLSKFFSTMEQIWHPADLIDPLLEAKSMAGAKNMLRLFLEVHWSGRHRFPWRSSKWKKSARQKDR